MKTKLLVAGTLALVTGITACKNNQGRHLNLSSGEEVTLVRDDEGRMVDAETRKPVLLYVDRDDRDTFYGITGEKVNGHLYREGKNSYVYDASDNDNQYVKIDGDEYKIKTGTYKMKWDADGSEYKYKDGDVKIKADGDGYKVKRDGYTKKVDEDGDIKIETGNKKIKIDGETGERKVKEQSVFSKVKNKIKGE